MRISDWSSDVCSSDLFALRRAALAIIAIIVKNELSASLNHLAAHIYRDTIRTWIDDLDVLRVFSEELSFQHLGSNGEALAPYKRSEERRVGKECVSTCRSRWSPYH